MLAVQNSRPKTFVSSDKSSDVSSKPKNYLSINNEKYCMLKEFDATQFEQMNQLMNSIVDLSKRKNSRSKQPRSKQSRDDQVSFDSKKPADDALASEQATQSTRPKIDEEEARKNLEKRVSSIQMGIKKNQKKKSLLEAIEAEEQERIIKTPWLIEFKTLT